MTLDNNFIVYKQKKELLKELRVYQSLVFKKIDLEDFKSALSKIDSALILIDEFQSSFDLKTELEEFKAIRKNVVSEYDSRRKIYIRRYNNLLKETLTEDNLENFLKLLAMLKNEVDDNLNQYNLHDLQRNIITYFTLIKKIYTILSSYKVLNYRDASARILKFIKEVKIENYPNLKALLSNIYRNLLLLQFEIMAENYDRLSLHEISEKLAIAPNRLEDIVNLFLNKQNSPIKKFKKFTNEVIFNQ